MAPPEPSLDEVLAGARSVLVLEDIVDHTNVGAIFRSGAALGFDAQLSVYDSRERRFPCYACLFPADQPPEE